MGKDSSDQISAIFNPRRVRAPSVVVTGDSPTSETASAPLTLISNHPPQIQHSDSVTSSQHECASVINMQIGGGGAPSGGGGGANTPTPTEGPPMVAHLPPIHRIEPPRPRSRWTRCRESCCSSWAFKMYFGIFVTILVTITWVGATHAIKFLYLSAFNKMQALQSDFFESGTGGSGDSQAPPPIVFTSSNGTTFIRTTTVYKSTGEQIVSEQVFTPDPPFDAPFFVAWFCTNLLLLFFPIYLLGRAAMRKCEGPGEILGDILRNFRDRGFTVGRFLNRCIIFCVLWLLTTYLYICSLKSLFATDVLALFATNVACVYLLSWVILHEQFVGVRIVAVILCDTGIALLAYMDGITGTPTLGGVVTTVLAAAGYAVFKVMFRKMLGEGAHLGQTAFTFTCLGFLNLILLWPICIALYWSGIESMSWDAVSMALIFILSVLWLLFHLLTQFGRAVTYSTFVTLGLITSVPVSAALDITLYEAKFAGMKLSGVILIGVGFFLVMLPNNWPDYITRLLRTTGRLILRYQCCCEFAEIDYNHYSKYHLVGSQREMGATSSKRNSWEPTSRCHRLSNGLYPFTSSISIRTGEMTDCNIPADLQQFIQLQQLSPNYNPASMTLHSPSSGTFNMNESSFMRRGSNRSNRKYSYGSIE